MKSLDKPSQEGNQKIKKLPVSFVEDANIILCLELLSVIYEESCILPVTIDVGPSDDDDYLSQKYLDQVTLLVLEVQKEIVFPLIRLYDSEMFVLNYQKFYMT